MIPTAALDTALENDANAADFAEYWASARVRDGVFGDVHPGHWRRRRRDRGDPLATDASDDACRYLVVVCVLIERAFNPARAVVGGG